MVANITRQEETLFQALKPVVASLGVDLIDVDVRDHKGELVAKIVIDSDDGIGIEDCGRVSEQVAPVLEVEDPELFRDAQIEVTSPGVDRRLRRSQEFDHYRDREVTVKCYAPFEGQKTWTGTIQSHTDEQLTIETCNDDGVQSVSIPLDQVASVRLNFDADEFLSSGGNNQDG
jgi:ribosome maturation factor RimP